MNTLADNADIVSGIFFPAHPARIPARSRHPTNRIFLWEEKASGWNPAKGKIDPYRGDDRLLR